MWFLRAKAVLGKLYFFVYKNDHMILIKEPLLFADELIKRHSMQILIFFLIQTIRARFWHESVHYDRRFFIKIKE